MNRFYGMKVTDFDISAQIGEIMEKKDLSDFPLDVILADDENHVSCEVLGVPYPEDNKELEKAVQEELEEFFRGTKIKVTTGLVFICTDEENKEHLQSLPKVQNPSEEIEKEIDRMVKYIRQRNPEADVSKIKSNMMTELKKKGFL